ncbi:hypothetical protein H9P43_004497 [Blastocladiella emersonii ATCC 22665]|nr:hypothetical protein H9P43_004497 [Blastocladiella emersonii ATCC 22665]
MPEDCLSSRKVWLDFACPVLADVSFHREAVFRLERVHHDGEGAKREVDHKAIEGVTYRAMDPQPYDASRKYTLDDFMPLIEEDPYFTRRHRKTWGILKKSGQIVAMNLFALDGGPAFTIPDAILMPASRDLPARPFVDLDPSFMPYLRLVLRPVTGERYPDAGAQFTYQLAAYLRTDKANRDLCDPGRRLAARKVLRQLFRVYHPAMTKEHAADSMPIPLSDNGKVTQLTTVAPDAATVAPLSAAASGLAAWLHHLEGSESARTLDVNASRTRTEPYFRLGPGGMIFNYSTGEFAATCPPSWLLPIPVPQLRQFRAALVHGPSDLSSICAGLLSPVSPDMPTPHNDDAAARIPSRATLVVLPSEALVDQWHAAALRDLGPAARIVCLRDVADYRATTWSDVAHADAVFCDARLLNDEYRSAMQFESMAMGHVRGAVDDGLPRGAKSEDPDAFADRVVLEGFFYRRVVIAVPTSDTHTDYLAPLFASLRAGLMPGTHAPFFGLAQLLIEARAARTAGIQSVEVPGATAAAAEQQPEPKAEADTVSAPPQLNYGLKMQAVLDHLQTSAAAGSRTVIWCQSPELAALIARVVTTTTDLSIVDAASPNLALAERALTEFNEGTASQRAIVLSLLAADGSVVKAPLFPRTLKNVQHVLFVHPVVGASETETLKLVRRAIWIAEDANVAVKWLVAKDTVEEQLMAPIAGKYGFSMQAV